MDAAVSKMDGGQGSEYNSIDFVGTSNIFVTRATLFFGMLLLNRI